MNTNKKIKVLIVEDDDDLRRAVLKNLNKKGFDVSSAASGEEGLRLIHLHSFDVILSDFNMPNGDGLWLLKAVKEAGCAAPFVLVTGNTDLSEKEVKEGGAFGLLRKPARISEYHTVIEAAIDFSKKNCA